jgi:predicted nuclease of restriction endonuclease-like (RecB) superfamily
MRLVTSADLQLPDDYGALLEQLKQQIRAARLKAQRIVNTELLSLYWAIGRTILDRQQEQGWGAKVIDRLAADLRAEFQDMTGLSRSNLEYMRRFAAAWPKRSFPQQTVGGLPWGHVTVLLDKLDDQRIRDWYAAASVEHGWSRAALLNQIKNRTHQRLGAAPSNFADRLPVADSDLARELAKDPYVFDFLGLTGEVAERELEQALMDRLQNTLMELGRGFAFVGRQVPLDVDGDDFYVDLLFFHVEQLRYVVVELKVGKFQPEFAGKLGFYVSVVDDAIRKPQHNPTVGLLLCADRNERVVRYSLGSTAQPMAVSTYTYDTLPPAEQQALPAADEVAAALDTPVQVHGQQLSLAEYIARLERQRNAAPPTD